MLHFPNLPVLQFCPYDLVTYLLFINSHGCCSLLGLSRVYIFFLNQKFMKKFWGGCSVCVRFCLPLVPLIVIIPSSPHPLQQSLICVINLHERFCKHDMARLWILTFGEEKAKRVPEDWNASYKVWRKRRPHSIESFPREASRRSWESREAHRNSLRTAFHEKVPEALAGIALSPLWFLPTGATGRLVKPECKATLTRPRRMETFRQGLAFWGKGKEMRYNRLFCKEEWRAGGGTPNK